MKNKRKFEDISTPQPEAAIPLPPVNAKNPFVPIDNIFYSKTTGTDLFIRRFFVSYKK